MNCTCDISVMNSLRQSDHFIYHVLVILIYTDTCISRLYMSLNTENIDVSFIQVVTKICELSLDPE